MTAHIFYVVGGFSSPTRPTTSPPNTKHHIEELGYIQSPIRFLRGAKPLYRWSSVFGCWSQSTHIGLQVQWWACSLSAV